MRAKRRRKSGRIKLPAVLQGSVDLRYEVTVIDLSMSGAMIEHSDRLSPGRTCFLFLPLPGLDLRLRAQLVWSQINKIDKVSQGGGNIRFRSGVHFPHLTEGEVARLRQYLTTVSGEGTDQARAALLAPDPEEDPAAAKPEEEHGLPDSAFFSRFR
ncbi:MAG TPA: PilZ domain-containing protein [Candidatus Sulfotelmatobacter sp.]|nr:PilZ domain-containing protein [Candidatus Sulfotelmatobacter sp.]